MSKKEALNSGLLVHAKARTQSVVARLRDAMAAIELDIEQNEGIYPYNSGRLTQAEVCRRASVHNVTLQSPAHKTTTRHTIDAWLKQIQQQLVTGRRVVRKAVTIRADDWKSRYLQAARMSHLYHNQLVSLQDQLEKSVVLIDELEAEIIRLRAAVSDGKIVRIQPSRHGG